MGNNQAYAFMEETVIGIYNLGILNKKIMTVLLSPYRDSDIDSGGSADLVTKDGLSVKEVIIKIMKPQIFKKITSYDSEDYWDRVYTECRKITQKHFGW